MHCCRTEAKLDELTKEHADVQKSFRNAGRQVEAAALKASTALKKLDEARNTTNKVGWGAVAHVNASWLAGFWDDHIFL